MSRIVKWFDGKKTYITMAIAFIVGGLEACGITVPGWVYAMLGALGMGFLRGGIKKTTS